MMRLEDLTAVMRDNETVVRFLSAYINNTPRFLTTEMVEELAKDCSVSHDVAFRTLFSAACGLDTVDHRHDRELERIYLEKGLHHLDPSIYRNDAYMTTVKFPSVKRASWELCEHFYAPYEVFACNHPILTDTFREIPRIGYFDEVFSFPAVLEGGVEWMTVTPNEIETMKEPIAQAHGRVLTLGLGLGYFSFHASQKPMVESVCVVEKDPNVITLFKEHLLPQFPNGNKIEIVQADAFDFMKQEMKARTFDVAFCDLWHDPSDGLDLYLELKRLEPLFPKTAFSYWIEPSLLSVLRHMVLRRLTDPTEPLTLRGVPLETLLSDEFLKTLRPSKSEA